MEEFCSYWQIILSILVSLRHISAIKEDLKYELLVNVDTSKINFVLLTSIIVHIIIHTGTAISTHSNEGPTIYKCGPYNWCSAFLIGIHIQLLHINISRCKANKAKNYLPLC
jgi:hypothetical protein